MTNGDGAFVSVCNHCCYLTHVRRHAHAHGCHCAVDHCNFHAFCQFVSCDHAACFSVNDGCCGCYYKTQTAVFVVHGEYFVAVFCVSYFCDFACVADISGCFCLIVSFCADGNGCCCCFAFHHFCVCSCAAYNSECQCQCQYFVQILFHSEFLLLIKKIYVSFFALFFLLIVCYAYSDGSFF